MMKTQKNQKKSTAFSVFVLTAVALMLTSCVSKGPSPIQTDTVSGTGSRSSSMSDISSSSSPARCGTGENIVYTNQQYGFRFTLPASWMGFTVVKDTWKGYSTEGKGDVPATSGPFLSLRNPKWTASSETQDIPIEIFTLEQWKALLNGKITVGAAPVDPTELGRNSKYVFVLPARYNYAFLTGWEEVSEIIKEGSLQPIDDESTVVS